MFTVFSILMADGKDLEALLGLNLHIELKAFTDLSEDVNEIKRPWLNFTNTNVKHVKYICLPPTDLL